MVLLGEQGGGHQNRHLLAVLHGDERGAHRHFGFAEPDVAADEPVHRLGARQIGDGLFDGAALIGRDVERELIGEALVLRVWRD